MRAITGLFKPRGDWVVRRFLRDHLPKVNGFVSRIDKNDEMYFFDLRNNGGDRRRTKIEYYLLGRRFLNVIRQVADWRFGGLQNVGAFLDFAAGYGRSTRYLVLELPPERIWACDISADAVQFQKRNYSVNGIVSVPDPGDFPKAQKFDLIFAASFFSHMPESSFGRWIQTLGELLTERGLLLFSTHDASLLPESVEVPASGIFFTAHSESRTLDRNEYGTSYVTESFVTRVVDQVSGGKARVHRIKRGLAGVQDLYIMANASDRDFSDLNFVYDIAGRLETCHLGPTGHRTLTGWAADLNLGGSVKEIQFISRGRVTQTVRPSIDRPDVAAFAACFGNPSALRSGWACSLRNDCVRPSDIVKSRPSTAQAAQPSSPMTLSEECSIGGKPAATCAGGSRRVRRQGD